MKLFLKYRNHKFIQILTQFIKFGIVGCSNTILSLGIYYFLIHYGVNYLISNTVGFVISVLNAFYWNSKYVFKERKSGSLNALVKVYLSYGVTFILSSLLLYVMVDIIYISPKIAPIINLVITIPLNFILNKVWAMK